MATQYLSLKGTLKWAKLYEPDSFSGSENWKVAFYPFDGGEWEKFQKTGLQLKVKEDIDGKFITFRRPTKKLIKDDLVMFSPPEITGKVSVSYTDADGNKIRQYNKGDNVSVKRVGEPVALGNGTLAIVNFSYYSTQKGPGHRLENVNILDLVEYEPTTTPATTETPSVTEDKVQDTKNALNDDLPW